MTSGNEHAGGKRGDNVLVAEYVLGVLGPEEHARVAAMIARDRNLQNEEAFWQLRLSSLDEQFEEVPAPAGTLKNIESRLFGTTALTGPFVSLWNSVNVWRGLAAGGLAVAVLAIGLSTMAPQAPAPVEPGAQLVASLSAEDSDVRFLALYDGDTGSVRLTGLSGEPVSNADFELWIILGDDAPTSLGVIPVNARSEAVLSEEQRARVDDGTVFAVTLEPLGGAPEGVATGPIVAAGAVTRI